MFFELVPIGISGKANYCSLGFIYDHI